MTCGFPDHEHITVEEGADIKKCRFCGQRIVWGLSTKGKRSPADPEDCRNHWITCPRSKVARQAYPRGSR